MGSFQFPTRILPLLMALGMVTIISGNSLAQQQCPSVLWDIPPTTQPGIWGEGEPKHNEMLQYGAIEVGPWP